MTSFEKLDKGKIQPLMTRGGRMPLEKKVLQRFDASYPQRKALTAH
jgi:hypothetical protein